jgi:hypothetical protein
VLLAATLLAPLGVGPASAQDTEPTNEVPTQDIVPKPNSGTPPEDAGDRGGALQLLVLGLIVAAVAFGAWHLTRQVQRGRAGRPPAG